MSTITDLIKAEYAKGGEQLYKGNPDQPRDDHGRFAAGDTVRFDGKSADGKVEGFMDVKIINPHSNADKITHSEGKGKNFRQYEGTARHLPTATVERPAYKDRPAKQFEAYHHTLQQGEK